MRTLSKNIQHQRHLAQTQQDQAHKAWQAQMSPLWVELLREGGNLNAHVTQKHENEKFYCDRCEKSISIFGKKKHLRLHKKRDQQKIQPGPHGVIHCDQCDYKARRRVYFNRHYNIEHGKIRFTCNQCEFESENKSALKQHTLRSHENIKYLCEVCKKTYPTKGSLRMHTNSMHEEAEWKKCDHCDYKAKTYHVLDTHVGSKHNGVTFICDQCDFSAKWSSHLNKHKRTKHDGVRFKCDLCDNDYSSLADVSNHKRMKHDGVRFDCNQCDVKLSIQYSLQNHINSKHTDKWIKCEQCHIQQHFKRP